MDNEALKQAIEEMRKDMRARVGKKLLSIEVHSHADGDKDEADAGAQPDDSPDPEPAKKMGVSVI